MDGSLEMIKVCTQKLSIECGSFRQANFNFKCSVHFRLVKGVYLGFGKLDDYLACNVS